MTHAAVCAEDQSAITFHFFHESAAQAGKGIARAQDGLFETFTQKSLQDPYLSVSAPPPPFSRVSFPLTLTICPGYYILARMSNIS